MTDLAAAQKQDLVLNGMLNWLVAKKKNDLRTLLEEHASSEEGLGRVEESSEFHDPPEHPLSMLYTQKGE